MTPREDVISVAVKAGESIMVHGKGDPAVLVAGALVAGAVAVAYGSYVYGSLLLDWFDSDVIR